MKHHVQLVTILTNSAFQSSALALLCMYRYIPCIAMYVLSIALKSRIRQDRDQLYMVFHTCMYRYMSVYVGTIL
jgi:hypothetical protein